MMPRTTTPVWIAMIAVGLTASVFAKKQADKDESKDAPPTMNVQVNDAAVRTTPSFLAEVVSTRDYGDPVGVMEEADDWMMIQTLEPAITGWMHASALTKTKIKLDAGETDANIQANKEELTAGGRGFNQEVEDKFREEHEELEAAYKLLDRMVDAPAGRVSRTDMIRFMRDGELTAPPGGVQ
jgi:SH3-like domain-containing protein